MDISHTARAFLQERSLGVLSTVSSEGRPRSRTVYVVSDEDFSLYFLTVTGTRKVDDIAHDAHASFVVSDEEAPRTLQIEGMVSELTDTARIDPLTAALVRKTQERGPFFAPLAHLDPGTVKLYKLTPSWVRWGDFTDGLGAERAFTEIPV